MATRYFALFCCMLWSGLGNASPQKTWAEPALEPVFASFSLPRNLVSGTAQLPTALAYTAGLESAAEELENFINRYTPFSLPKDQAGRWVVLASFTTLLFTAVYVLSRMAVISGQPTSLHLSEPEAAPKDRPPARGSLWGELRRFLPSFSWKFRFRRPDSAADEQLAAAVGRADAKLRRLLDELVVPALHERAYDGIEEDFLIVEPGKQRIVVYNSAPDWEFSRDLSEVAGNCAKLTPCELRDMPISLVFPELNQWRPPTRHLRTELRVLADLEFIKHHLVQLFRATYLSDAQPDLYDVKGAILPGRDAVRVSVTVNPGGKPGAGYFQFESFARKFLEDRTVKTGELEYRYSLEVGSQPDTVFVEFRRNP